MNVYLYTKNSPLLYVDRGGMKAKQAVGEGVEYLGGAALDVLDAIDWRNLQNSVGS
jgi:hypothetical protein